MSRERAHIELRALDPEQLGVLQHRLVEAFKDVRGVFWLDVVAPLGRVVMAFDREAVAVEELVAVVERCEEACGVSSVPFTSEGPEHPADLEPIIRSCAELGADALGLAMAVVGRLAAARVLPVEIDALALTSLLEGAPTLRRVVDEWIGTRTSGLVLGTATALAQGLTQSPLGPLTDIAWRTIQVSERLSRRAVFLAREPQLAGTPRPSAPAPAALPPRPVPLAPGPIEQYSALALAGSVGAFGVGLATTGSLADASGPLLAGLPKPARLGREAFAASLDRTLAAAGIVTLDAAAIRRLDRIATVVLPAWLRDDPAWDAAVAAAHDGGLGVETVDRPDDLLDAIRSLQATGRGVLAVADAGHPALAAADLALGVVRDGAPPWDAHLLGGPSLDAVGLLVDAATTARTLAQQSVTVAEAAVGLAVLTAFGGRLEWAANARAMAVVHVASLVSIVNGMRLARAVALRPRAAAPDATPWHRLAADDVVARLRSDRRGLRADEAARRLGPAAEAPSSWTRFADALIEQLETPLTPILTLGAGLSAAVGSVADAALVAGVAGANAVIGALQQVRTEDAIATLRAEHPRRVRVLRDGVEILVPPTALVPGDVVRLEAGDGVPADCRILDAVLLEVDESSLTGESLPVVKTAAPSDAEAVAERASVLWEGTTIAAGSAVAMVFAVGAATEAQRAAEMARDGAPRTGVEARLESLVGITAPAAVIGGGAVAVAGLLRGRPLREVVAAGVSLAVAAVPEGLPLLATVAQLAAARRLSTRGALVRNPRSIEAMGRADVVCLDKTGTLTEGRITLRAVWSGARDEAPDALSSAGLATVRAALRATPAAIGGQRLPHLTDRALVEGAARAGIAQGEDADGWQPLHELPFEPARGFHAVIGHVQGGFLLSVKGAPEIVLPRCIAADDARGHRALDGDGVRALAAEARRLARGGLRVLAVAEALIASDGGIDDERVRDLAFRGFLGLADPVRPSAAAAIAGLQRAGVRAVMMTGDHPSTAECIASELGLVDGGHAVTGAELDVLDDDALAAVVPRVAVFSRVTPAHKARLVRALQRSGRVVAMTGDGANDAPAIRLADVGIALGKRGTSGARSAADLVVTDDRIETLVDALLEGRAMWAAVRDAVAVLVGGNLGEIGFTVVTGVLAGGSPLNTRQLLLVNLLTDAAPAMAIALRPPGDLDPERLLREGPEASLGDALVRDIACRAIATAGGAGAAWLLARATGTRARADTVGLVALVGAQLGQTLATGGRGPLVLAAGLGSLAVLGGIVQTPLVSGFFGCRPLGPVGWGIALGAAAGATGASLVLPALAVQVEPWVRAVVAQLPDEWTLPWIPDRAAGPPGAAATAAGR